MSHEPVHPATPYYPAPAYAPEPPKDLTALAVVAFATAATATAFDVGTALVSARMLRSIEGDPLDWSLMVYGLGSVLELVALAAGWVTGSLWLHRARKNAEVLNPTARHARSAGWAWGGWFCPVVALWFPFQVVRDVLRAVAPTSATGVLGWWWALFLAMTTLGNILGGYVGDPGTGAAEASTVQSLSIVVAALTVAALVLWGAVLQKVTRAQHARMY